MGILNVLFVVAFVIVAAVFSMVMNRTRLQKLEAANKIFLEKYPDAAKVYPYLRASITSEAVQVHSVVWRASGVFLRSRKTQQHGCYYRHYRQHNRKRQ
jgi:hypothetical protein